MSRSSGLGRCNKPVELRPAVILLPLLPKCWDYGWKSPYFTWGLPIMEILSTHLSYYFWQRPLLLFFFLLRFIIFNCRCVYVLVLAPMEVRCQVPLELGR